MITCKLITPFKKSNICEYLRNPLYAPLPSHLFSWHLIHIYHSLAFKMKFYHIYMYMYCFSYAFNFHFNILCVFICSLLFSFNIVRSIDVMCTPVVRSFSYSFVWLCLKLYIHSTSVVIWVVRFFSLFQTMWFWTFCVCLLHMHMFKSFSRVVVLKTWAAHQNYSQAC